MTKIKNFFLNGQLYYVEDTVTISDLINYFNFNDSLLVLEYNNFICDKKNWKETVIQNEDKIEIVTIVGGG
jgi:sulfur carrier protein